MQTYGSAPLIIGAAFVAITSTTPVLAHGPHYDTVGDYDAYIARGQPRYTRQSTDFDPPHHEMWQPTQPIHANNAAHRYPSRAVRHVTYETHAHPRQAAQWVDLATLHSSATQAPEPVAASYGTYDDTRNVAAPAPARYVVVESSLIGGTIAGAALTAKLQIGGERERHASPRVVSKEQAARMVAKGIGKAASRFVPGLGVVLLVYDVANITIR